MPTPIPKTLHSITAPRGFRAAGLTCGIKPSRRPDLALIAADKPCRAAAVFTTNQITGAPVIVGQQHLRGGRIQAIVCNSGIANVATGDAGLANAQRMFRAAASALGCTADQILPSSTGVIGQKLPIEKITSGIKKVADRLAAGPKADADAARAIMTTDTRPKAARRRVCIGKHDVTLGGIAKGAGMIAPNMATMLAFITTDADIALPLMRRALRDAVNADASFNRLSIDSDTSTSDTVALLAGGMADAPPIRSRGTNYRRFADALTDLCTDLAYQIVSDGEGVTRVIRCTVLDASTDAAALQIARTVVESPLVKTAVHGGDPNWGRIAMAVGRAGVKLNPSDLEIRIGPIAVLRRGCPTSFDLAKVGRLMNKDEVAITVRLGRGLGRGQMLGADLSRQYVTINADYHT